MKYHSITEKIQDILKAKNFWYEAFEHQPVHTSEDAAKVRTGYSLKQGAKALVMKVDEEFLMLVMPADLKFDSAKVKKLLNAKKTRFATPEEVEGITGGVKVGGVPPFGNLFELKVIVDPKLFDNEKIIFNAGDRCFSVAMKSEDYKTIVQPVIEEIT